MLTMTELAGSRGRLLGCLIALARTCSGGTPTENTLPLLQKGLCALSPRSGFSEERLQALTRQAEEEKYRVSPGCATCTARCGKNEEYDLRRLAEAPESIREIKLTLTENLIRMARAGKSGDLMTDTLFALAEDWDEDTFAWYLTETKKAAED